MFALVLVHSKKGNYISFMIKSKIKLGSAIHKICKCLYNVSTHSAKCFTIVPQLRTL